MEDLSKYSTEELEAMLQDSPQSQSAQPAQPAQTQAPQAPQEPASDMPDLSQYSTEDLERMIGEQGTAAGRIEQMFDVGTDRSDEINPLEEAAKGAGRAVKAIGGAFVGLGSGAVRLAGTPVRALTGWDGLHRVADAIDSGYEDWGAEALASELPDDDWGRVIGGFGEKMAGTAGSLGAMAAGGGLAKLGAAGKFGAASKAVGMAGAALQKSLPFMFGNDAAVRTYDTAKENGSGTLRALGLASVNGAIHYFGFKAFENQSLNKMLGMPQEMTAMMPAWANAARAGGAKTFTELASGVRNGMFKYILAERAKGALKAGGIMGLQNFLSSVPTQMAEGAGVGDVDWGRAVSEGVGGVEEGALMEALMGGAAMLKTPKAARKFIADTYFRNGYDLPNGRHVPGLLHSEEGRSFVMKQNPEMQRRILDILDHGGKVTKGELNAACLPPDMTEAELREFAKDWRKDLASEWDRAAEPETLGEGEELEGNEPVIPREQQMRNRAKVNEMRDHEQRVAEAEEAERARAEEQAADDAAVAAEEANWAEANAKADAERAGEAAGAEQLAREEAYPQPATEQPAAQEQAPAQEPAEPPVVERSNRLRRNLKPNFRHQGENQQQPQQEVTNETGNVPVEAQPEPPAKDAGRNGQQPPPQAAEGLVEGEAPRGEVPAAGEVAEARPAPTATPEPEPVSKSDRGGQKLTGGAKEEATPPTVEATPSATKTEPPAAEPPKNAPTSAPSAEGTTTPPKSADAPQGGESAAGGATGDAAEEPKPTQGNKLRRGKAKKGRKLEAQEPNADSAPATQEATPEATTPATPAVEQTQSASQFRDKNGNMKKTLRGAVERISLAIGNRTGKGAITSEEADNIVNGIAESPEVKHNRTRQFFTPLVTDAEWQNSLGVDAESAKNLRDAVARAKTDSEMAHFFVQVDNAVKKAKAGKLSPKDAVPLNGKISEGLEKAEREGRHEAAKRLREALEVIKPVVDAVSQEDVDKFNRSAKGKKLHTQLDGSDRRRGSRGKTVSLDTKDGTVDVGTDGGTLEDVADEISESSHDRRTLKPGESYGKGFTKESDNDTTGTEGTRQGSTGKGGDLAGKRKFQIVERNGDDITVAMRVPKKGVIKQTVKLSQLRELAESDPDIKLALDSLEKGGELRVSKPASESPASRDARDAKFAADADYQRWLKSRKANDAEPLRQRYEMEQAKALGDAVQNAVGGVDFEYVGDRDYDPAKDNPHGGRELTERGTGRVLGIFDRDTGKLKLFRGANWKTLNHELGGHATMRFAEQEAERGNRALLDKINESIDNAPQWLKDEVKSRYPDADEATLRDEIWAALRERPSEAMQKYVKTLQGRKWYSRAWDAIKAAWRGVLSRMGFNRADLSGIDKMTPDEFNEFLDKAMIGGKTLGRIETASPQSSVRMARGPAAPGTNIMDDKRTTGEKMRERFLNSDAPMKDLQDEVPDVKEVIRRTDGYTDWEKSTDVVAAKQKAQGRLEHETRQLQRGVDSMAKDLNAARLDGQTSGELLDDLNLYAQCKHAKERNETIAQRNGVAYDANYYYGMGKITLPGGKKIGLSENVANRLIAGMQGKYGANFANLEAARKKLVEIGRDDIRRRLESGKLSASDANYYLYHWNDYVPLKTDIEKIEPGLLNSSTAGPKRNEFMKAFGRANADIADSPVAAMLLQAEQGIRGSIRNELANVLANFVEHAEAKGLHVGEIVEGIDETHFGKDFVFTFSDADHVKANAGMQMADKRDDIQLYKRDGKLYAIRMDKGANGRGLDVMKSFKGDSVESWGDGILSKVPKVTHWMSAMRTQYSPEFTVSNYLADSLEAAQALMGRYGVWDGAKAFGKSVAAQIRNAKDVWKYVRTGELNGDVKKAIEAGLLTKGGVASAGFEAKEGDVRLRLDQLRRKADGFWKLGAADKAKWIWENGRDFIAAANEFMEYSTRIGLFSALHQGGRGVPVNEAVKFAREATVDFNRKGTFMPIVNGLYMFANASVQGAARAVQAGKESFQNLPNDGSGYGKHKFKGDLVALLVGVGAAKAVIDYFGGNDDEREKAGGRNARNMTEYDKKHNVGIPVGGGRQIPILRFRGPYAALPYLAQTTMNVILGETKPKDALAVLPRELTDQITDLVGGNGMINDKGELDWNLTAQSLAPSAIDPIIQLASGKDYKGSERKRRTFDKTQPVSHNGKPNTPWGYKAFAKAVNALSGGSSLRKGKIDIAPEDAQLVWEFIWGGLGRDIGNVSSTAQNVYHAVKGGNTDRLLTDMPIARRLVREYPESTSRYFDALDDYERDKAEFKKTTELGRRAELKKAHPYLTAQKGRVDALIEQVQELTHRERGEVKVGQKWVPIKTELPEARKEAFRKRRLRLQAEVLRILGK